MDALRRSSQWRKGLRQGDPIELFLFLVVAEGLNGMLKRAVNTFGSLNPLSVSLLQFADDTLFIGKASIQNAVLLKCILRCFELISGLKVNFSKSKIVGICVGDELERRMAAILHCRSSKLPFMYLGLPIGSNPRNLRFWDPVVSKIRKRLSRWKQKTFIWG